MSEAAVIRSQRAREGAPRVLEPTTLPAHSARLYRAAYALCGSRDDAEDLVQETYARVLRRPRLLRRGDDIVYLLRVLRNTWISSSRAAATRPTTDGAVDIELLADHRHGEAELTLELKAIYAAIRTLTEPLRETITAVDIAGLTYREAARALGTKPGTIMSRLFRAREKVAAQVDPTIGATR
ncbi:MAG: RNA polymerase sigma factor [Solirubrobacterales bacterium]|nr:RNA polymerase sigma factor [Solirubrobacterales bacterium]